MIGFENELLRQKLHANEGPETRDKDKRELYETVNYRWSMAPFGTRGIIREYLLAVHNGTVFRVTHHDLRHFEVDLTPPMVKRIGVLNNGLLVRKLNMLLASKGDHDLGFSEEEPPDQVRVSHQEWLYRVARYIDRTNLLEFFESPVTPEPPLTPSSSDISRVYFARTKASKYFFRKKETRKNRRLWDQLRTISDAFRMYQSHMLTIEVLKKQLRDAERKAVDMELNLEDLASKASFSYTLILNPGSSPENILKGTDNENAEIRKEMAMNTRM